YVDDQCIDCDLCRETAPANFTRTTMAGICMFFRRRKVPRKKASAKRLWKGARWRLSGATEPRRKPCYSWDRTLNSVEENTARTSSGGMEGSFGTGALTGAHSQRKGINRAARA